ncbi:MAG: hypothetical protein K8R53_15515 [Bacteroidales bacterium]|nr:hypothetical protein [Bacteroidales bacterium]
MYQEYNNKNGVHILKGDTGIVVSYYFTDGESVERYFNSELEVEKITGTKSEELGFVEMIELWYPSRFTSGNENP